MLTLFPHTLLISIEPFSSVLLNILTHGTPNGFRFSLRARLSSLPRDVAENYIQHIPYLREILLYSEKDWTQMVAMSADQLEADSETTARILQRI
jgi:hypothetical protein